MARFFIHRPVFAWVLAIVTMLAGIWAILGLPVSQYPDIAPTTIRIGASYPGATARAVQNSVTTPIEDALTGLDGLLYTVSSSSTGRSSITLTFDDSADPVDALNEVQSKVRSVEGRLPAPVQNSGVTVSRSSSSILMVGSLVSTTGQHSTIQLGNLLEQVVEGPVKRTPGVGGVDVFGSGYAMRIWMDPLRLAQFQLTPTDITTAVAQQNSTVSVGSLGSQPVVAGQQFTATITAQSQLTSVEDFRNILLKTGADGAAVRLGDVAEVEIGQASYGRDSRFNGMNASGFAVNLATGANAVETANAVRATLAGLANALPEGVEVHIAYDTAPFVELSIEKVYHTLIEAIGLVFLVILLFLQNWRATLIPIIAIPVVLLGTFAMLAALGYSINTLTMFAMVLAIGLLVDDAIVVVENVERVMAEEGLDPVAATEKSMGQISGALIGIALVLSAVFLPMAFMPGSTGVIYRQFSATIITAMVLSLAVALILTPAMCASLLRPSHGPARWAPARAFNAGFDRLTRGYGAVVRRSLRRPALVMLLLAAISLGGWQLFGRLTTTFIPAEDQGVLQARITLTEGSTAQQTAAVVQEIEDYLRENEAQAVDSVFVAMGFGFSGSSQRQAMIFVKLRDFDQRQAAPLAASAVAARANAHFQGHRAGRITFLQPPAIPRLGNSAGFSLYLLDQSGGGLTALTQAAEALEQAAAADPRLQGVDSNGGENEAALKIAIDQQKAESLGVSLSGVNAMLSTIFAGTEVNDFSLGAQLRPVIVQAAAAHRMQPQDIDSWYARNSQGEMVPFSAFMTTRWEPVEPALARMDGIDAIEITGQPGEGASSGQAMAAVEELVAQLPGGYGVAWTGLSYQERQSGDQAPWLFALSALVVFLSLAALYESWSIPFSVMLAVPVGVLGAVVAALALGQANDVYFKVGILTTIGLAAKNAILIVEFARDLQQGGRSAVEAASLAARQRLRPILMTSLAFILGVLPLAVASGAGAAAQNSIGIGVMGGMISATVLGIFMVPAFYVTVRRLTDGKGGR
ncbi:MULTISPECIES: efflux RND transporter permease subunit [unclassified Paracoccus (in: a-proteobacteria)]|uniref:efflux RND transporter permease subunit n=1 Tax=unclassified Paracoccus (in: a-proteobacteria) TaxID=2688777 RepID=UPI0012B20BA3|nr:MULTISPECIES: efflux RND transporter permease subunit [unclassified Paracoccus (in: a-proteobacteria)]UXU75822.1 efflux RND transporter permease subunit [Paracoccus sp. SMMA_5]UXU81731.1 efflux RND transporter permease subunit [Paracoccus sp. SMMA_5_TC]